jgi:archaeal type IV pilus assembly protein PilA
MNVFGHSERRWRKAQKRGVSPIIATILLVAITVVLAAVLYVLISGLTHGPGSTPIGSAFTAGNPTAGTCAVGSAQVIAAAAITGGCKAGDFVYTLTVESSTVTFGSVQFEVKTSAGAIYGAGSASSSFAVLNIAQQVTAVSVTGANMAMTSTWASYGTTTTPTFSTSTPLTNLYTIVIDMGSATATTGMGLTFVTLGVGSYSGTTATNLP